MYRSIRYWTWGTASVLSLTILSLLFAYSSFGGSFVEQLGGKQGETLVKRARALAAAKDTTAAIATYRVAVEKQFDSAQQRHWARREYAGLLHSTAQYEKAASILRVCVSEFPADMQPWSALCGALAAAEKYQELAEAAGQWYQSAEQLDDASNRSLARYYLGLAQEKQGNPDAAVATYLVGHSIDPKGLNAYHAAVLLNAMGDDVQAGQLLNQFIPHSSGWRRDAAVRLRARIEPKTPK
ncbi:MAG: tetratricopeptide repeat protein [Candidatus Hydrogenedentes bacterium]|nr:tetratricopeptide repeat protein [Candidatus Hydrogenedentota bacterium]